MTLKMLVSGVPCPECGGTAYMCYHCNNDRVRIIEEFVAEVDALAEKLIEMVGTAEGAHYNAMRVVLQNLQDEENV